jgi:hypothetical protein
MTILHIIGETFLTLRVLVFALFVSIAISGCDLLDPLAPKIAEASFMCEHFNKIYKDNRVAFEVARASSPNVFTNEFCNFGQEFRLPKEGETVSPREPLPKIIAKYKGEEKRIDRCIARGGNAELCACLKEGKLKHECLKLAQKDVHQK